MTTVVDLHHRSDGPAGRPVLLLGGSLGTSLEMWDPQLSALSAQCRVIRFDNRGHGASPVPDGPYSIAELGGDVLALMDRLEIERADYCGLSIGGMVGQWLAIHAAERIERLVVICSSPRTLNGDAFTQRAATVREAGSVEVVADAVVARWFTEPFAAAHPDVVASHRAMVAGTPPEGYASCCEAVAGHDVRGELNAVQAPTLVIGGAQDTAIAPEQGREIAAAVPGAAFELLDPAAHLSTVERAGAVTDLIIGHLT
ncbi:MAG: 3-oxoadipate enol-lactonase [Solirubrobacteraceae bacterium]